ncbi:CCHC-type domain-containing protein [Abeliophyllum distichum]|uniref:CCHC-type domain-containing protein n=1 Tax=Abeliophyllum distichum TaxID=126358 RepID=A0ABD1TZJ1_9LAMI
MMALSEPFLGVRFVPNLKRNLVSLGVLEDDGCMFKFDFGTLKILKGSLVVMKGPKRNGLYYLHSEALHAKDSGFVSINTNRSDLWHRRMGHIGNNGLKYLSDHNLLGKDTVAPLSFCESCVLGKSHRVKQSEQGKSSTGKKIQTEVKRLDANQEVGEPEQIDPQVKTQQVEVLEKPELEIPETVIPNQEQLEETILRDYQLVRDRERRQVRPNLKYLSSNLIEFVLVSGEALESVEPISYEEAVNFKILKIRIRL